MDNAQNRSDGAGNDGRREDWPDSEPSERSAGSTSDSSSSPGNGSGSGSRRVRSRDSGRGGGRSTRVDRQGGGPGGRVLVLQRKPRYQGPFGGLKRLVRGQKSPLLMAGVLAVGFGVIGILVYLISRVGA